ncbi:MAG: DUF3368 domain-containing protein [Chloroflexi bacterium]|nr:DUF3368 domain-containing protein [Chloroflexota bacterium]
MPAVSNSSPLILFSRIHRLALLHALFDTILVPPAVHREVVDQSAQRPGAVEVAAAEWIQVRKLSGRRLAAALHATLGAGEAEAIALAVELRGRLPLLVDDRAARLHARARRLPMLGSAGIVVVAKERGLVPLVLPRWKTSAQRGFTSAKRRFARRSPSLASERLGERWATRAPRDEVLYCG